MEVDNLNLCAIIEACAKGGVTELKFGDIEIHFGPRPVGLSQTHLYRDSSLDMGMEPYQNTFKASQASEQSDVKSGAAFDRDLLEDLRISQLMIDDPHGFEREIVDSHLRGDIK